MLISKSKSTLLKSIAMIVTVLMVVCICLTACADKTAQDAADKAQTTADKALQIAEEAQGKIDSALKDYITSAQASELIKQALEKFATDDGEKMVSDILNSEAGSKLVASAVAAAIDEKIANLQTADQVKELITNALNGTDASFAEAVQSMLSGYMASETGKQLASEIADGLIADKGLQTSQDVQDALDAYKTTVGELISEQIGTNVSDYIASEEGVAKINELIGKYHADGKEAISEVAATLIALDKEIHGSKWTTADEETIADAYEELIAPMYDGLEGETDIVKLLYLLDTADLTELSKNVTAYKLVVDGCESMEEAAARINAMIAELGRDINGDISDDIIKAAVETGKFGHVLVVADKMNEIWEKFGATVENGKVTKAPTLALLTGDLGDEADDTSKEKYKGFDLVVMNLGTNANSFDYITHTVGDAGKDYTTYTDRIGVDAVLAPTFEDEEKIAAIDAEIQALVDKFSADYPDICTVIPGTPDDTRTEEDESTPDQKTYKGGAGLDYDFYCAYVDLIEYIKVEGKAVIDNVNAFFTLAGENFENLDEDAREIPQYKNAYAAYAEYNACRFDNVVPGVEEAYQALVAAEAKIDAAIEAARLAEIAALQADYDERLAELEKNYYKYILDVTVKEIRDYTAVYTSPFYGSALTTAESMELNAWTNNFTKDPQKTLAYVFPVKGTLDSVITDEVDFEAEMDYIEKLFNADMYAGNDFDGETMDSTLKDILDGLTEEGGEVKTALDEIDASYWFETIQVKKADEILAHADAYKGWNLVTAGTPPVAVDNDIYDLAVKYVTSLSDTIRNYKVDETAGATPYLDAMKAINGMFDNVDAELAAMLKYYNSNPDHSPIPSEIPLPSTYITYAEILKAQFETFYKEQLKEYTGADEYQYLAQKKILTADYEALVKELDAVAADISKGYVAAIEAMDAKLDAAKYVLLKDVAEFHIDQKRVATEQILNSLLKKDYTTESGAVLFQEYWAAMLEIIHDYQQSIIPSETYDKFSEILYNNVAIANAFKAIDTSGNSKLSDEEIAAAEAADLALIDTDGDGKVSADELAAALKAVAAFEVADTTGDGVISKAEELVAVEADAIAAVDMDLEAVKRDLARYCYTQKLQDDYLALRDSVGTSFTEIVGDKVDTFGFYEAIKNQIDDIVWTAPKFDAAKEPALEAGTDYLAKYEALYNDTLKELKEAVDNYKTLLTEAVELDGQHAVDVATDLEELEDLFDEFYAEYSDKDYKGCIRSEYDKLLRKIAAVTVVLPMKDENTVAIINKDNLETAYENAISAIEDLIEEYETAMDDYADLMDQYVKYLADFKTVQDQILGVIDRALLPYTSGQSQNLAISGGFDAWYDAYLINKQVFQVGSVFYNSLVEVRKQIAETTIVMEKSQAQIDFEKAAIAAEYDPKIGDAAVNGNTALKDELTAQKAAAIAAIDPYFSPMDGYKNTVCNSNVTMNGEATVMYSIISTIKDQVSNPNNIYEGTTGMAQKLNRLLKTVAMVNNYAE